jgi:predicted dehydrogenase
LTKRALEAGKHVFCEKPLALTSDDLDGVLRAAADAPGILSVGFNRRFSRPLQEARLFLDGKLRMVANYRVSAGSVAPEHWVHDLRQGGGRALGELCHFVDSLVFLVSSRAESVYAVGYSGLGGPVQARDNLVLALEFADGSVGSITYTADGAARLPKERVEAFSGSRTIVLDDYRRLELLGPNVRVRKRERTQDKGHRSEIAAFLNGVQRGEPPVALAEIGNVSLATLAIVESLRTGRPVHVVQRV